MDYKGVRVSENTEWVAIVPSSVNTEEIKLWRWRGMRQVSRDQDVSRGKCAAQISSSNITVQSQLLLAPRNYSGQEVGERDLVRRGEERPLHRIACLFLISWNNWFQRNGVLNEKKLSYLEITRLVFFSIGSEIGARDQVEFNMKKKSTFFLYPTWNYTLKPTACFRYLEEWMDSKTPAKTSREKEQEFI